MRNNDLKDRTKLFAAETVKFIDSLPRRQKYAVIGKQLLRSGTSVGANYRSACRGRSAAEFISKMGIVEEELDESMYWIELLREVGADNSEIMGKLYKEADELLAIIVASIRTAKKNCGKV